MGTIRTDELERIERLADRGERWLLVSGGLMVAGLLCLAAGAPVFVPVLVLCSALAAAAMSARDLVPVYRGIIRLWRQRRGCGPDRGQGPDPEG